MSKDLSAQFYRDMKDYQRLTEKYIQVFSKKKKNNKSSNLIANDMKMSPEMKSKAS